ncbi:MAG: hypothetical protein ACTHLO_04165 [Pseudolabrys sp.]
MPVAASAAAGFHQSIAMWQVITAAPADKDVQVAVIDREGEHPLIAPCRRTSDGWIDAVSRRRLDIRPTHWRPWPTESQKH